MELSLPRNLKSLSQSPEHGNFPIPMLERALENRNED